MTSAPTAARGYVDDNVYLSGGTGQLIDLVMETVPDLFWPTSIRTYARMRHDTQLAAILKAYALPIRRASWAIDGSDCRPEVTAFIADEMGLPILGQDQKPSGHRRRSFQWHQHLRLSLLDLTYGHMAFERIYDTSGPLTRIANVYERMPQTIYQIHLGKDGSLQGIQQHFNMNPEQPVIESNALVWYANEREGTNFVGQSLLRPAWAWWLLKHEVARVHATSIRRFGMGVPQVTAPPGASPQQVTEAQRLASSIRVGDQSGVGLPQGFQLALQGLVGSVPDAVAFIEYLDKQMTRSTLTSLLDLADTTHGSRALGETFMDLFMLALQAYADEKAQQATDQFVVPLVDLNWSEDEACPRIVCGDVGSQHEVTAQTMMALVSSGAISADPALEEYLRREYKLPDRSIPWVPPPLRQGQSAGGTPRDTLPGNDPTSPDQGNIAASEVHAAQADQFPRQPTPHEVAAQTDFAAIQAALTAAVAALVAAWAPVTAAWRTQINQQIGAAALANDVTALGSLTLDSSQAAGILANSMQDFAQKAAVRQSQEAAAQGMNIAPGAIDVQRIQALAQTFADQLANGYAQTAARAALTGWGENVPAADVLTRVDDTLTALSDRGLTDTLEAALHVAQNDGRTATLSNDPGTHHVAYASSEILDKNTCDPCRAVDGKFFPDLATAKAAYPLGGYVDCQGRLRCRGVVVTVWSGELELAG